MRSIIPIEVDLCGDGAVVYRCFNYCILAIRTTGVSRSMQVVIEQGDYFARSGFLGVVYRYYPVHFDDNQAVSCR